MNQDTYYCKHDSAIYDLREIAELIRENGGVVSGKTRTVWANNLQQIAADYETLLRHSTAEHEANKALVIKLADFSEGNS